jgi:hypothetical protein
MLILLLRSILLSCTHHNGIVNLFCCYPFPA